MALKIDSNNGIIRSSGGITGGLATLNDNIGKNISRLASGNRINQSADDPAGLAIADQLTSSIKAVNQGIQNVRAGRGMLRTAESALGQISDLISRGRELAVRASTGGLNSSQRDALNSEFAQVMESINSISGNSESNGQKLLNGELGPNAGSPVSIQVGENAGSQNRVDINVIRDSSTSSLQLDNLDLSSSSNALTALSRLDSATTRVVQDRTAVGSLDSRFQSTENRLQVRVQNLASAESQIRGTDFSSESASFAQNKTLLETGLKVMQSSNSAKENLIGSLFNSLG